MTVCGIGQTCAYYSYSSFPEKKPSVNKLFIIKAKDEVTGDIQYVLTDNPSWWGNDVVTSASAPLLSEEGKVKVGVSGSAMEKLLQLLNAPSQETLKDLYELAQESNSGKIGNGEVAAALRQAEIKLCHREVREFYGDTRRNVCLRVCFASSSERLISVEDGERRARRDPLSGEIRITKKKDAAPADPGGNDLLMDETRRFHRFDSPAEGLRRSPLIPRQ